MLPLKASITTAADDKFRDIFLYFRKNMIYNESHPPADESHYISCLLLSQQNLKLSSAANYRWRFMGYLMLVQPMRVGSSHVGQIEFLASYWDEDNPYNTQHFRLKAKLPTIQTFRK